MLKSATIIFSAIFSVIFLGKRLYPFNWLGVALASAGIVIVGFASILGASYEAAKGDGPIADASVDAKMVLFGIALCLCGQVAAATQNVTEEWLLKDVDLPATQIIGFEGVWGVLIMLVVAFPVLYFLPGGDDGHQEDGVDALIMIFNNNELFIASLVCSCAFLVSTLAGIAVTGALSSVHRVMLGAFRAAAVWVYGLCVHYFYDSQSRFGESWRPYSYLEVIGFAFVILGQAIYGKMLIVPCLSYPSEHMMWEEGRETESSNLVDHSKSILHFQL